MGFDGYKDLVRGVERRGLSAVELLRKKYGDNYRGHLGIFGNALVASSALSKCFDVVLEPAVSFSEDIGIKAISADVAVKCKDHLIVLEVKAHHRGEISFKSQLNSVAYEWGIFLRRKGVEVRTLHLIFHDRRPPHDEVPRWNIIVPHPFFPSLDEFWSDMCCSRR